MEITDPYNQNSVKPLNAAADARSMDITIAPGAIVTLTNVPLNALPDDFKPEQ